MEQDPISAYRWIVAFVTLGLILALISRFKVGYIILYYLATMVLVFLLLTQYQAIATLLSPFNESRAIAATGSGAAAVSAATTK